MSAACSAPVELVVYRLTEMGRAEKTVFFSFFCLFIIEICFIPKGTFAETEASFRSWEYNGQAVSVSELRSYIENTSTRMRESCTTNQNPPSTTTSLTWKSHASLYATRCQCSISFLFLSFSWLQTNPLVPTLQGHILHNVIIVPAKKEESLLVR